MGAPYSTVAISGYNSNPPSDDGSTTEANRVKYATTKTKLADPIKSRTDSMDTAIIAALGKMPGGAGIASSAGDYTVLSTDQGKLVRLTASGTLTTPDATSVGAPFVFFFKNDYSAAITLDGNGAQTIDGAATISVPAGKGGTLFTDGTNWFTAGTNWSTSVLPKGHLFGLTLSNAADTDNDITVAAGKCRDSTDTVDMTLSSALTKQLDASWVVGTASGGRSSAGLADDTWHVFVIGQAAGASADVLFHNAVDPTSVLPTNYLYFRRIGSFTRVAANTPDITQFTQYGDFFSLKTPVTDIANNTPGTSAVTGTLATLPTDIAIRALINATSLAAEFYISPLTSDDMAPTSTSGAPLASAIDGGSSNDNGGQMTVWLNTSAQFRYRCISNAYFRAASLGWWDTRGRDA